MKRVIALFLSLSFIFALVPAMTLSVSADSPAHPNPLCFTANINNSTVRLADNNDGTGHAGTLWYTTSTDINNAIWMVYYIFTSLDGESGPTITLTNAGDKVYFAGDGIYSDTSNDQPDDYYQFYMSGSISASGSVNSLINSSTDIKILPAEGCFYRLFRDCKALITSPKLPATGLTSSCYNCMFTDCDSLTDCPALPATQLANNCYEQMFFHCISLEETPVLQAKSLADSCYAGMFQECSSLVRAPELPATILSDVCYFRMFLECTSLEIVTDTNGDSSFNGCWNFASNPLKVSSYALEGMFDSTMITPTSALDLSKNSSPYTNTNYYFKKTTATLDSGNTTPAVVEEHDEEPQAEVEIGGMDLKLEYGNDTVVLNKEAYEKTKDSGENAGSKNYRLDFRDASVDVLEAIVPKDVVQDLAKQGKGIEFENRHGFMVIEELDDTTNNSVVIGVKDDVASHSQIKALGTTHVEAEFNIAYKTNGREIEGDATVYIPCDIANPRLFYVIDENTMGELPCRVSGGYCVFDRYLDGTYVVCK